MHGPKLPSHPNQKARLRACRAAVLQSLRQSNGLLLRRPNDRSNVPFRRFPRRSTGFCPNVLRSLGSHRWRRPRYAGSSDSFVPIAPQQRLENPFQTSGYCRPQHRAIHRWIDRHRQRNRCFYAPPPRGAAIDIGQRWYPDIRRQGYI